MAVGSVEIIGNRRITDLGDGRYMSTPTQPGVMGAGIIDEAAVQALREKYSGGNVYPKNPGIVVISPKDLQEQLEKAKEEYRRLLEQQNPDAKKDAVMDETEFNKKTVLYSMGGLFPMLYGLQDEEYQKARDYYTNNTDTKTGKVYNVIKKVLGFGLAAGAGFLLAKNFPAVKTIATNVISKIVGLFK